MKLSSKITQRQKDIILIVGASILSTLVLVFSLLASNRIVNADEIGSPAFKIYAFFMFLFMSIARAPMTLSRNTKLNYIRNGIYAGVFLVIAIVSLCVPVTVLSYGIIGGIFALTLIANRIIKLLDHKSVRSIITNCIAILISVLLAFVFFFSAISPEDMEAKNLVLLLLVVIITISLFEVLFFCFSRIKLKAMSKIIRKTFAIETLYGLAILVIASSFIFYIFDPEIASFGDALWYSFAIVTTIGFGDFVATTAITRIISVILGFYGLIVVAVLTSVIVNFYNETSKRDDEKDISEIMDEVEEQEHKQEKK